MRITIFQCRGTIGEGASRISSPDATRFDLDRLASARYRFLQFPQPYFRLKASPRKALKIVQVRPGRPRDQGRSGVLIRSNSRPNHLTIWHLPAFMSSRKAVIAIGAALCLAGRSSKSESHQLLSRLARNGETRCSLSNNRPKKCTPRSRAGHR